jgi:exodeoxyribonuclease VII small subunit
VLTNESITAKPAPMDGQPPEIGEMSFEQALRALEDVVRQLEGGEVPLEESIGLYERGEALRRHCQARLDAAQARIEKIVAGPDGKAVGAVPFDAG